MSFFKSDVITAEERERINKNLQLIREVAATPVDVDAIYETINKECPIVKMSKGDNPSYFGMFIPDKKMEINIYSKRGREVKRAKTFDYRYFFDKEGRIRFTERYLGSKGNYYVADLISYIYTDNKIITLFNRLEDKINSIIGYAEYNKDGLIKRYVFSSHPGNEPRIKDDYISYFEYIYQYDGEKIILNYKRYSEPTWFDEESFHDEWYEYTLDGLKYIRKIEK